jgi:glutaredoxin
MILLSTAHNRGAVALAVLLAGSAGGLQASLRDESSASVALAVPAAPSSRLPQRISGARPDLVVYVSQGCPHCARARAFLADLKQRRPALRIEERDVTMDPAALAELRELAEARGLGGVSVPTFVLSDTIVVGFHDATTTGRLLESLLERTVVPRSGAPGAPGADEPPAPPAVPALELPLVGRLDLDGLGLPLFTVALGLIDGFNPCAMWVLLFLLSLLVNVPSRRRMFLVGGVFVLASGLVYYAFMAAWLNAFLLLGMSRSIQIALACLALVLGGLNLKDALWLGRGPSLSIPESARPGIYARARRVVTAETLPAALGSVAALALLVNTVELLCTAGLPALFTHTLSRQGLDVWQYHAYLALYDVFYMLDDAAILTVAVITLSHHRLQARGARGLKLLSGSVMCTLGLVLLFRPDWIAAL